MGGATGSCTKHDMEIFQSGLQYFGILIVFFLGNLLLGTLDVLFRTTPWITTAFFHFVHVRPVLVSLSTSCVCVRLMSLLVFLSAMRSTSNDFCHCNQLSNRFRMV